MAIMARACWIAVISIKIMKWSAVFWYHLYLNLAHQPSEIIGHGVTSFRKYSLKIEPWLVQVELCKLGCPSSQTGMHRSGHLHKKTSYSSASTGNLTGWLSTSMVGLQWSNKVRKCLPEENGRSSKMCPYPAGWSKLGWFHQETVNNFQGGSSCLPKITVIAGYPCPENNGIEWKKRQFCNNTDRDFGYGFLQEMGAL